MTAIVFHEGKLIADRQCVNATSPISFTDGGKIFKSEDGQFAYGSSGVTLSTSFRKELEPQIRKIIEHMLASGSSAEFIENILGIKSIDDNFSNAIIVTKDTQFTITPPTDLVHRLDNSPHSLGTGGVFLVSLLRCGMKLKEASKLTSEIDYLTGEDMEVIVASKLKPFIIGDLVK